LIGTFIFLPIIFSDWNRRHRWYLSETNRCGRKKN